ncbi:uncharacterized protein LOC131664215 isoform X2 [Phymastichus coffea]|uniref:uncharacterized protein LOC131664215 isoform X2 n=1 Tax=Phymastichus coffea TaxID=108790 RepID=UPI00273C24C1|nr:uncharacterized protein LOC131664215 isoform X2 [Phymastichus coffea]
MRIFAVFVVIVAVVISLTQAQNYHQLFAGFGPYLQQSSGMRDPRSNTGPVVFPPSPTSDPNETSGVIVGASGYGFVPPNAAFWTYWY